MTTLILINKQEPTSHENFGSAFLSFDTKKEIKAPKWWVNNSPLITSETLKPLAENVGVNTSELIVRSQLENKSRFNIFRDSFTLDDFAILTLFTSSHDFRHNKISNLLEVLIQEMRDKLAKQSIKENKEMNEESDSQGKGGFFSKLFGK